MKKSLLLVVCSLFAGSACADVSFGKNLEQRLAQLEDDIKAGKAELHVDSQYETLLAKAAGEEIVRGKKAKRSIVRAYEKAIKDGKVSLRMNKQTRSFVDGLSKFFDEGPRQTLSYVAISTHLAAAVSIFVLTFDLFKTTDKNLLSTDLFTQAGAPALLSTILQVIVIGTLINETL